MNVSELQACRDSLSVLTSEEHGNKNYLFMVPVDTTYIPDYTAIITRPMDLGTIKKKLESDQYKSQQSFWEDVDLVFSNAQLYHKNRKETQHVVKFAKDMMKLVAKEKKKSGLAPKQPFKLKLSLAKNEEVQKPQVNTKLKLALASAAAEKSKPPKPTLKLKLSLNTSKSSPPAPAFIPPPISVSASLSQSAAVAPPSATAPPKIRINASSGPSRGKELPKGVASGGTSTPKVTSTSSPTAKKASAPKTAKPKKLAAVVAKPKAEGKSTKPKKTTPVPKAVSSGPSSLNGMTIDRKVRCMKILNGLRRRQPRHVIYFLQPVSDKAFVDDYKAKIPFPMDLGTMSQKLERDLYTGLPEFALDLRRVFANCLRFNTTKQDSFRPIAAQLLKTAEELMAWFLGKADAPNQAYPPLLYCWELCINLIDRLLNVTNPTNGLQTAHYFMHPASYYFLGAFPNDYLAKVPKPMDFGTVTSNLIEGRYQSISAFAADCRLIIDNCLTYYGSRADGNEFTQQATHLKALMSQQLLALTRYDESSSAKTARTAAISWQTVVLAKPPESLLLSILKELREVQYTDRLTKLSQPVMRSFEKPVDLSIYEDYLQFAPTPMDLETVERKVRSGSYETPEDFEYDILVIFKNCEAYNSYRKSDQLVAMGKYGAKEFRKLFSRRMKAHENPEAESKKRTLSPASSSMGGKSAKKMKSEPDKPPRAATPRISITVPSAVEEAKAALQKAKLAKSPPNNSSTLKKKEGEPNQPVPLHVAISEVKSRYPLRRPLKLLEPWEVACAKFYKDLMKHPWISVARPKFIYHVPVPIIFPELKVGYEAKIKNPMDLTTAESKLFQGGLYYGAQDFVDDIALVFANAITFNKSGRDEGDHLSIAYYDASIYLLQYTRWLSLEHFQTYLTDDPHTDNPSPDGLPPTNWKLSSANRLKAREDMENMVVREQIDKGLEGDRFPDTWMESEIEKLLKALRHQSDLKHMSFFLSELSFPADYTAFISKPMAWERVQKNLKKRRYNTFGEVIEDLRLIFSNALKYNERHKDIDETSAKAYDGAIVMSGKLEAAIERMFLAVSDRLGREKVEFSMQEREEEAMERAEKERIRVAIANGELQAGAGTHQSGGLRHETVETIRVQQRRPPARRDMDMELPFFDEDDANHEQSHVEAMRQQRATFERQQGERQTLHKLYLSTGARLYGRHIQAEHAKKWVNRMSKVMKPQEAAEDAQPVEESLSSLSKLGSSVAVVLNMADRALIKLQPKLSSKKRKHPAPVPFSFE